MDQCRLFPDALPSSLGPDHRVRPPAAQTPRANRPSVARSFPDYVCIADRVTLIIAAGKCAIEDWSSKIENFRNRDNFAAY